MHHQASGVEVAGRGEGVLKGPAWPQYGYATQKDLHAVYSCAIAAGAAGRGVIACTCKRAADFSARAAQLKVALDDNQLAGGL